MGGLIGVSVAALVGLISALQVSENSMPLIISFIMATMLVYLGYRFGLLRLYIVAVLCFLWGYILSQTTLTGVTQTGAYFFGYGSLILLSGGVTLLLYIHRTQPAGEDLREDRPGEHETARPGRNE